MTKEKGKSKQSDIDELMQAADALAMVKDSIKREEEKYKKIAETDDAEPVLVEGITSTDHYCQLMADPKDIAKIFLDYQYPTWKILDEDAPQGMWEDIARLYGLANVCSVDL